MYRGREVAAGQWQAAALCRPALKKKIKKKEGGGVLFASRNAHLERLRGQRQQQGYLSE